MKKPLKVFIIFLLSFLTLMLALITFISASPYPTAWIVRFAFGTTSYTTHEDLNETKENVLIIRDIKYPSKHKNNTLDIIYPKDIDQKKYPVIYWVHGGAFVAGDKTDVESYMIMLANNGFVVVNINYELAPSAKYPTPLIQLGEAYQYINNSSNYSFIDKDIIYFGGDSAGAHIAAQFITIQTNPNYLSLLQSDPTTKALKQTVEKPITGAILFAGPYDFNALSNLVKSRAESNGNKVLTSIISFIAKRIGQGYLGTLNWKNNPDYNVLSITNYVSNDFPKTFITDGRTFSFEEHSKALERELLSLGVTVKSVYYDYDLTHEYQFNLGTISDNGNNYAQMTFDELLLFLNN